MTKVYLRGLENDFYMESKLPENVIKIMYVAYKEGRLNGCELIVYHRGKFRALKLSAIDPTRTFSAPLYSKSLN